MFFSYANEITPEVRNLKAKLFVKAKNKATPRKLTEKEIELLRGKPSIAEAKKMFSNLILPILEF